MVRLIIASLLVAFVAAEGARMVDPMLSPLKLNGEGKGRELVNDVDFMPLKGRQLIGDVGFNGGRMLTRVVDPMISSLKLTGEGEGHVLVNEVDFMPLKGRQLTGKNEGRKLIGDVEFMPLNRKLIGENKGRKLTRVVDPMLSPLKGRELTRVVDPMLSPLEGRELTNKDEGCKLTRVVDPMLSPLKGRELTRVVDPMLSPLEGRELTNKDEGRKLTHVMDPMLSPLEGRELTNENEDHKITRLVDPMLSPLEGRKLTNKDEGRKLTGDDQCARTCDHVRYKSMCRTIARLPEVTTPLSLLEAALRLSMSKAKAAQGRFVEAAKASHEGNPMASILESCVQSYGDLVEELEQVQRSIDARDSHATLISKLSSAGTYAHDCDNWFQERDLTSPYQRMQTHVARVVANTLGIAAHNDQL